MMVKLQTAAGLEDKSLPFFELERSGQLKLPDWSIGTRALYKENARKFYTFWKDYSNYCKRMIEKDERKEIILNEGKFYQKQ